MGFVQVDMNMEQDTRPKKKATKSTKVKEVIKNKANTSNSISESYHGTLSQR